MKQLHIIWPSQEGHYPAFQAIYGFFMLYLWLSAIRPWEPIPKENFWRVVRVKVYFTISILLVMLIFMKVEIRMM